MKKELVYALKPLGEYKTNYNQLKYNCPICFKDPEKKRDAFNLEINTTTEIFHCWSCGYSGGVSKLITAYGHKEYLSFFKKPKLAKELELAKQVEEKVFDLPDSLVSASIISDSKECLLKRGLTTEIIKGRGIKYCYSGKYKGSIIFPSYLEDSLHSFVSYNIVQGKYKNHRKSKQDFTGFYLDFIDKNSPIIITEGVFDALVVPNAIPVLGTELNGNLLDFLFETNVILAFDKDVDDKKMKQLQKQLQSVCNKVTVLDVEPYKDLNDIYLNDKNLLKEKLKEIYLNNE